MNGAIRDSSLLTPRRMDGSERFAWMRARWSGTDSHARAVGQTARFIRCDTFDRPICETLIIEPASASYIPEPGPAHLAQWASWVGRSWE